LRLCFLPLSDRRLVSASRLNSFEMSVSEQACTYAACILHDDGVEITADNIKAILAAANVTVDSYWPMLLAVMLVVQRRQRRRRLRKSPRTRTWASPCSTSKILSCRGAVWQRINSSNV
jgi:hypothetical protein